MPDDEKQPEAQGQNAAGGEQPGKEVPFHEHPRWKEVHGELKEWKKLGGNPGEIAARLQEAQELKAALEQAANEIADETARKGGTERDVNDVYKAAREELRKVLPEIDLIAEIRAQQTARYQRLERVAVGETKKVMAAAGLETDEKNLIAMTHILADIIKQDPDLAAEYEIATRDCVREAFKSYMDRVQPAIERQLAARKQRDREPVTRLPKAHGAGGDAAAASKAAEPAKTLLDAEKRALARLRGEE